VRTRVTHPAFMLPFAALVFILPFPGTVALRLLCLAAAFALALLAWRRLDPPPLPAKLALLLWASIAAASVFYSFDFGYSAAEFKNEVVYASMAYVAFFWFTRGETELRALLLALAAATAAIAAWGLVNTARTGMWPESAGHGGSGGAATFFCVAVPLLGLALAAARSRRAGIAIAIVLALALLAAVATRQRVQWPLFWMQFVMGVALLQWSGVVRLSAGRLATAVCAATLIAALGLASAQVWRQETGHVRAVDSRPAAWPAVIAAVARTPWYGAGFGRQAMRKGHPEIVSEDPLFWHAHNSFLNAAVSMGLPGAAALLFLFGTFAALYWRLVRSTDRLARLLGIAGLLLLTGVIGRNLTNDFFVRDGALLFWALNGALLGAGLRRFQVGAPGT
jgi:O-antigen ligase